MIASHPVSILGNEVTCTCGLRVVAVSATAARRVGSAHIANPRVDISALLAFVQLGLDAEDSILKVGRGD